MIDKKYFILLVVALLVVVFVMNEDRVVQELSIKEVCFEDNCFKVEIADSKEERALGLMNRQELCNECGMLFVYEKKGDYKFWMKNTLIPLDIIWLDSDLKVIHVADAKPCVTEQCELYGPEIESLYILEINSEISGEISLEKGSSLEFVYG